jgi:hypothetical protein
MKTKLFSMAVVMSCFLGAQTKKVFLSVLTDVVQM